MTFRQNALIFPKYFGIYIQLSICGLHKDFITQTLKLKKYNGNNSSFIFVTNKIKFTQHPFCSCHLKGIRGVFLSI